MTATVIRCQALTKYYGKSRGVEDLTFEVRPGQVFGFLGPNGAGKTTTIRCLLGLLKPTGGTSFLFDGEVGLNDPSPHARIGYVPGDVAFYGNQTGQWTIDYISGLRGGAPKSVDELCERLQYDPSRRVKELSKGNRQKLALVLALMHDPELMILDEPTTGLDPLNQQQIFDIIAERIADHGASVFLSSHILSEVERVCNRVGVIRQGRLVAEESTADIIAKAIRKVRVVYAEPADAGAYAGIPGVSDVTQEDARTLTARVTENLDGAIRALMDRRIHDLQVTHASLEEIFFEYYARGEERTGAPGEPLPTPPIEDAETEHASGTEGGAR
ncbi:MAG: ABC transporter ATP-binding protein [Coriobacteriia bacterium]|nr:ABC transporter ATP-binding protein [Coriobacteriia bacterium]